MRILIVGHGFVGTATSFLFQTTDAIVDIHDPARGVYVTPNETTHYDYIFLCVPTPMGSDGKLDVSILEEVYNEWVSYGNIVIRSTIGPDQCKYFPSAIMMPEFLRERHWQEDTLDPSLPMIVGDIHLREILESYFPMKTVYYMSNEEAMMYKLARNSALAMKVALANEFYEICQNLGISYVPLEHLLELDPAVGGTHWTVPGPDGKAGFGGKCLPKDLTHMSTLCNNSINIMDDALHINLFRRESE